MRITGTFLDEISHDIPHQNWGREEWERDFQAMKAMGIERVILIRCGHKRALTYPSQVLQQYEHAYAPVTDLVEMFLRLAEQYGMDFFFGTYDSGRYWWHEDTYDVEAESRLMMMVNEEAWQRYGSFPAFKGWYFSQEIARRTPAATACYLRMGARIKELSGNLPILISPSMLGPKAYDENMNRISKPITPEEHEREWEEIMRTLSGVVDIIAFQDGHLNFEDLPTFLAINRKLCARHGMECWSNTESFDRDMPIDFFPIKWEKLLQKLQAAERAGLSNAITFEFSHFMSPNSCYFQAHGLYRRYCEHFGFTPDYRQFGPL